METSKDFARAIKARYNIESDYALAKTLHLRSSTMSAHKSGRAKTFGEDTGYRIAELLDLPAEYVLSCLAAERSKDIKVKKVWQRIAELTRVAVLAPALLAVTFAGSALVTPSPIVAKLHCILCQVARRWLRRLEGLALRVYPPRLGGIARMLRSTAVALALTAGAVITAHADDRNQWFAPWSRGDVTRETVFLATEYIDWRQTRYIAKHPERYTEINPILGEHPSAGEVDRLFVATTLAHLAIVSTIPPKWRPAFQWFTVGFQTSSIGRNWQIGVRLGL